jgi:hypothetical protein
MAYMNQEKKKDLAPAIKAVLKKYKMKGTIGVRNYSTLVVTIKAGVLDIPENFQKINNAGINQMCFQEQIEIKPTHIKVNHFWIDNNYDGVVCDFLTELDAAMQADNYDNTDIMRDHFDCGYYIDIQVGTWEKPFLLDA